MAWAIKRNDLTQQELLNLESLFSLGNGYLGVRGNFEEGYSDDLTSIRGTYQNAFHDVTEITYGEKLHAFPEKQQKLLNIIDAQTIHLYFGDEEEHFSLFNGEIISYERNLCLDQGFTERLIHYRSPTGKEIKLHFRRLVSFTTRELFAIDIRIEPVNYTGRVKVVSTVNGDISNYANPQDPRVSTGHSKRLTVAKVGQQEQFVYVEDKTYVSNLSTACITRHDISTNHEEVVQTTDKLAEVTFSFELSEPVHVTKFNVYTDTLRHNERLVEKGIELQKRISLQTFDQFLEEQKAYLDEFWKTADIIIKGDEYVQEGIRFNLYQLLQSVGRDKFSNIAAKGLSGEGYEGHYFWDTEIYMFPVFLMTKPDIAKQLLIYRYSILDGARQRAKEMGHSKGALFPWRTISGTECSAFFPAGTAQYHISADIAYSYIQYYLATNDDEFMINYGAELLFETARLWEDTGHYYEGQFRIDDVTGPDEYTCLVNNNYYTNVMAKHNLKWAAKAYKILKDIDPNSLNELTDRLDLERSEIQNWEKAAANMYLPYDKKLGINPQDDTFLKKAMWDFENTPEENYPLLLHYHPLALYRYQVCKQADTVLAHLLLEDEQDIETIRKSYDYYEKITTHDSSLSSAVYSIMASKVGYYEKAYDYFIETARLDLDNTHGNTKDGLHMANMGGTWISIIYGFGGLRLKDTGLSLAPIIPTKWMGYTFRLQYLGRELSIEITKVSVKIVLDRGNDLQITIYGKEVSLSQGIPIYQTLTVM